MSRGYDDVKSHRNFREGLNKPESFSELAGSAMFVASRTTMDVGDQAKMLAKVLEQAFDIGRDERGELVDAVVVTLNTMAADLKVIRNALELVESEIR